MVAESQYVAGVNLMCHHLLPYHEQGQRKRDYPSHFSSVNPWIDKGFKDFNDYFSYLGKLIANSEEIINVGVLHPVRSAYFDYKTDCHAPYNGLGFLERPFFALMTELCNKGVGHHYLDEVLLAKYGRVDGQSLILGRQPYPGQKSGDILFDLATGNRQHPLGKGHIFIDIAIFQQAKILKYHAELAAIIGNLTSSDPANILSIYCDRAGCRLDLL